MRGSRPIWRRAATRLATSRSLSRAEEGSGGSKLTMILTCGKPLSDPVNRRLSAKSCSTGCTNVLGIPSLSWASFEFNLVSKSQDAGANAFPLVAHQPVDMVFAFSQRESTVERRFSFAALLDRGDTSFWNM